MWTSLSCPRPCGGRASRARSPSGRVEVSNTQAGERAAASCLGHRVGGPPIEAQWHRAWAAGIFPGMFSAYDPDAVLAELGDEFLRSIALAVAFARQDVGDMRAWRPGWFPKISPWCLAN